MEQAMNLPRGLAASLLLNVVLLMLAARGWSGRAPAPAAGRPGATGAGAGKPATPPTAFTEDPAGRFPDGKASAGTAADEVNWARLNTADWFAYRDGLRAWGCPERTIHDILEPAVRRRFAAPLRDLAAPWVTDFWELARDPESFQRLNAAVEPLLEEMNGLLASLLGKAADGAESTPALEASTESRLAFLPAGTRQQVAEVLLEHRRRLAELRQSPPADATRLADAQRELDARLDQELAGVLSPEQLAEYRLRQSPHATVRNLEGIDLSPDDLARIVAVQDRLAADPGLRANPAELSRRRQAELEKVLGPERWTAFERANRPDFQSISALAHRAGASPEQAVQLWEARETFRREVESLAGEPSTPRARREALLAGLRDALGRQADEVLGGSRGREMWEHQQRAWLEETFRPLRKDPFAGGTGP